MDPTTTDTHRWHFIADIVVTETVPGEITDDLYFRFVNEIDIRNVWTVFSMAQSEAGSISATQRKRVSAVMSKKGIAAVVITDDTLTRGIVTAVSWLGVKAKAFTWKEIEKAIEFTTPKPEIQDQLRKIAFRFRAEIDKRKK